MPTLLGLCMLVDVRLVPVSHALGGTCSNQKLEPGRHRPGTCTRYSPCTAANCMPCSSPRGLYSVSATCESSARHVPASGIAAGHLPGDLFPVTEFYLVPRLAYLQKVAKQSQLPGLARSLALRLLLCTGP